MTRGTVITLAARFASVLLNALLTIITSRGLGAVGRATYAEATNAIYVASALPSIGFGTANAYFSAGRSRRGAIVANSALVSLSALALGGLVVGFGRLAGFIEDDATTVAAVLVGVPVSTAGALLIYVLLGSNRIVRYNAVTVLQPLMLLALLAGLLLSDRLDASYAIVAFVASQIPVLLVAIAWSLSGTDLGPLRPDRGLFRRSLSYAGAAQLAGLLVLVNYRIGLYIVDPLAGRAEAGVLSVALVVADGLSNLPHSLAVPLLAESARVPAGDPSATARAALVSRVGLMLVAGLSLPLLVTTALIAPMVFGHAFQSLPPALLLLVPSVVAMSPRVTSSTYLHAVGRPGLVVAPAALGLLTNVGIELALVPRFGANGACVAVAVSTLVTAAALLRSHSALTGTAMRDLLVPRSADARLVLSRARGLRNLMRTNEPVGSLKQ